MIAGAVILLGVALGAAMLSPLAPDPFTVAAFAALVAAVSLAAVELLAPRRPAACGCTCTLDDDELDDDELEVLAVGKLAAGTMTADLTLGSRLVDGPLPGPVLRLPAVDAELDRTGSLPATRGPVDVAGYLTSPHGLTTDLADGIRAGYDAILGQYDGPTGSTPAARPTPYPRPQPELVLDGGRHRADRR